MAASSSRSNGCQTMLHCRNSVLSVAAPIEFTALRPPLKWAGGKRWQVPYLLPLWQAHAHRRLVEPFCGGLAVTLGLAPKRAVLNDVNPHLINFYRWLARGLAIEAPMENDERAYYGRESGSITCYGPAKPTARRRPGCSTT